MERERRGKRETGKIERERESERERQTDRQRYGYGKDSGLTSFCG